jgi:predicted acylesterase/phospholipase RssA
VYERLSEAGIHPHRIAGVSIGTINGAIIAGNPVDPEDQDTTTERNPSVVLFAAVHESGIGTLRRRPSC